MSENYWLLKWSFGEDRRTSIEWKKQLLANQTIKCTRKIKIVTVFKIPGIKCLSLASETWRKYIGELDNLKRDSQWHGDLYNWVQKHCLGTQWQAPESANLVVDSMRTKVLQMFILILKVITNICIGFKHNKEGASAFLPHSQGFHS